MRLPLLIWSLIPAGLAAFPLLAGQIQSHESIREVARQHILARFSEAPAADINILPAELDRRLRLTRCERPLESFSPTSRNNGIRRTVGIRCNGTVSWTLYVAVKVEVSKSVLVANRRLERGRILAPGDFRLEKRMVSGLARGYIENPKNALGSAVKLTLKSGAVLSPGLLKSTPAVKRGSQVTILGRAGGIEVRMSGKALSDGARGERIKVRNSSSSRQVEGTVITRGTVEVTL